MFVHLLKIYFTSYKRN